MYKAPGSILNLEKKEKRRGGMLKAVLLNSEAMGINSFKRYFSANLSISVFTIACVLQWPDCNVSGVK